MICFSRAVICSRSSFFWNLSPKRSIKSLTCSSLSQSSVEEDFLADFSITLTYQIASEMCQQRYSTKKLQFPRVLDQVSLESGPCKHQVKKQVSNFLYKFCRSNLFIITPFAFVYFSTGNLIVFTCFSILSLQYSLNCFNKGYDNPRDRTVKLITKNSKKFRLSTLGSTRS